MKIRWLKVEFNGRNHWNYNGVGILPYPTARYYLVLQMWNEKKKEWIIVPVESVQN